ncbi:helix-turn-helix domain-containing protein [Streptomyces sp. NBC_00208]|uniref:helix-turn-helix transcriptional regulator n=1 Tax=Streptomyces sp. NBC_00208 TaxID=2975681 RepID=UPI002E2B3ECB|nr:helix-turn-helix transcriptional regulator [Streptomyces sp. NBC_00208]
MPDQTNALTRLVREHVGEGRPLTIRVFAERAIDPKTGTTISKSTAGNLLTGARIKITPEVLGAIAAGLGVTLAEVQAAAMAQYVGVVVDDPFDTDPGDDDVVVRVAHEPGKTADDMPRLRAFLARPRPRA